MQFSTHIDSGKNFRSKLELIRFILHETPSKNESNKTKCLETATESDVHYIYQHYIYHSNNILMKNYMFQRNNNMKLFCFRGSIRHRSCQTRREELVLKGVKLVHIHFKLWKRRPR